MLPASAAGRSLHLLVCELMEYNAVRFVDLDLFAVHDKETLIKIHATECHRI